MKLRLDGVLLALPLLLALLLYAGVGGMGYVWDDLIYLENSVDYQGFGPWLESLRRPFLDMPNYFRPLVLGMFVVEQGGSGGPAASHWVNLFIFLCNIALTMALALRVGRQLAALGVAAPKERTLALVAGLIYALCPVLTEPVSWISARFDLMVAFFSLGLLLAERARQPWLRLGGVYALFLLAALSKEMALGTALLLPLWQLLFKPLKEAPLAWLLRREQLAPMLAVLAAGMSYLMIRHEFLGYLYASGAPDARGFGEHVALVVKTVGSYLLLLVYPYPSISPVHLEHALPWHAPQFVLGALLLVTLPVLAVQLWRDRLAGVPRVLALLLLGMYAALFPVLNVLRLSIGDNYVHERFLVLPAALFAIMAALAILELWRRLPAGGLPRVALVLPLVALLLMDVLSIRVNLPFWRTELSLWTLVMQRNPDYKLGELNLAAALIDNQRYDEAEALLARAQARDGAGFDYRAKINYAALLMRSGRHAQALPMLREVERGIAADDCVARLPLYQFMGAALFVLEGPQPARAALEQALACQPHSTPVLTSMAATYYWEKDAAHGDEYVAKALQNRRADRATVEGKIAQILEDKRKYGPAGVSP